MARADRRKKKVPQQEEAPLLQDPVGDAPVSRREPWIIVIGLFLAAFAVRLVSLGRADLWCDEILFVTKSSPPATPGEVLKLTWDQLAVVTHLPLPRLVQNIFLHLTGTEGDMIHNPYLQRWPALIWGALAAPMVYLAARKVCSRAVALGAGLMMALLVFPFYYSRDAYYYAPLMFFGAASLWFLLRGLRGERWAWGFVICATGMVYLYLTGVLLLVLILVSLAVVWAWRRFKPRDTVWPLSTGRMLLIALIPLVFVSPFIIRLASLGVKSGMKSGRPLLFILYDAAGKLFMGSMTGWNVPACILFLAGGIGLWMVQRSETPLRRYVAGLTIAAILVLSWSAHTTQYNARYFSVLSPLFYIVISEGLMGLVRWSGRLIRPSMKYRSEIYYSLLGGILAWSCIFYLPLYWKLEAKSVDFGGIARWLNEHLEPGMPYVMESGYELRFVSGYFPTPGLVPACPYIHGDMDVLHRRQQDFILRFPESVWIESARHGAMPPELTLGSWSWPHRYFRQRFNLTNAVLGAISERGIGVSPGRHEQATHLSVPIWYNTPQDIRQIAKENGQTGLLTYPGWECVQVAQFEYARAVRGTRGLVRIENLTDKSQQVRLHLSLAVAAQARKGMLGIFHGQRQIGEKEIWSGQLTEMVTEPFTLQQGHTEVELRVSGIPAQNVQALILDRAACRGTGG
jgi:hypothetical protein